MQKSSGEVVLRIVPGRAWSNGRFEETARRLASYFVGLPFHIELVDAIPPDPSGKRRVVMVERSETAVPRLAAPRQQVRAG